MKELDQQLMKAAAGGFMNQCKELLDKGADANCNDPQHAKITPLMTAAQNGHAEVCSLLLSRGANVNAKGYAGSALMCAVAGNKVNAIKVLLGTPNIDVNARLNFGETVLDKAVDLRESKVCAMLLKAGANVNQGKTLLDPPLLRTVLHFFDYETCALFVQGGLDLNKADQSGMTELHRAAKLGDFKTCELLIKLGAKVGIRDNRGLTALHMATNLGSPELCKLLIWAGADPNDGPMGYTPLDMAAGCQRADVVYALTLNGADPNQTFTGSFVPSAITAAIERGLADRPKLEQDHESKTADSFTKAVEELSAQGNVNFDTIRTKLKNEGIDDAALIEILAFAVKNPQFGDHVFGEAVKAPEPVQKEEAKPTEPTDVKKQGPRSGG